MAYYPKSRTTKWQTPPELYKSLDDEFHFDFDPCPIDWKQGDPDGLLIDWGLSTFCNPPYDDVSSWVRKSYEEHKRGKTVVMLINACTDTKWFHEYILDKAEIRFIKGRLKFIDPAYPEKKRPNVRPSMVVVFRNE
jgi:site-specific DNA-methyltransferase (adenine-specific)